MDDRFGLESNKKRDMWSLEAESSVSVIGDFDASFDDEKRTGDEIDGINSREMTVPSSDHVMLDDSVLGKRCTHGRGISAWPWTTIV